MSYNVNDRVFLNGCPNLTGTITKVEKVAYHTCCTIRWDDGSRKSMLLSTFITHAPKQKKPVTPAEVEEGLIDLINKAEEELTQQQEKVFKLREALILIQKAKND